MSSNALFASPSVATGCWIGCVVARASPSIACSFGIPIRRAGSRGIDFSSQTSHCASKSTRDRELIELGQRIWNPEILIVIAQNLRRAFQGITAALRFAYRGDDAQLDPFGLGFDRVKLTSAKDIQV